MRPALDEPRAYPILGGRLVIVTRPPGYRRLAPALRRLRASGVTLLASALDPDEAVAFGLGTEAETARRLGMQFVSLPIPDRGVPADDVVPHIDRLARELIDGGTVAVHCAYALGRSPLIAAAMLVRLGVTPKEACRLVSEARGTLAPESANQRAWVLRRLPALAAQLAPLRPRHTEP
jgi:protein-tyrosine phosphatase